MNARRNRKPRRRNGLVDIVNGLLSLLVIVLVVAAGVVVFGAQRFYSDGPADQEHTFLVERGQGLSTIAQKLEVEGLVKDRWTFQFGTMAQRKQGSIKAGEYNIAANASMADVLHEITEGKPITYSVTFPEGYTSWQIVQKLNEAGNLTGEISDIPPEGSLMPDTYSYQRDDDRQTIIDEMSAGMNDAVAEIWAAREPDLPFDTPADLVTVASIVEKETGLASERPLVAAVFVNRLRAGMRLQSDPTTMYGVNHGERPLGRGPTQSELQAETPYNTYQIGGLPAGPIANPGREALEATAHPAESGVLYFVADGTGGHAFSSSYSEHRKNVTRWHEIEDQQAADEAEAAAETKAVEDAKAALEAEEAAGAGEDVSAPEAQPSGQSAGGTDDAAE